MSTPVVGLLPSATIEEAAAVMLDRGYTTLPVLDDAERLVGVLTESGIGITRILRQRRTATPEDGVLLEHLSRHVRSAMRPPLAVPPEAEVEELASLLVASGVRCIPVVEESKVVGMVSWRDVLGKLLLGALPVPAQEHGRSA